MRRLRSGSVPLLLAALLVTAACGDPGAFAEPVEPGLTGGWTTAGCEFQREPMTTTMGSITLPLTPPALDAAMARIDRGGRAGHPDSYAGLEVDQERVRAVVYRVPSADFDQFIRIAAEDACIVVRDAAYSLAEMTTWQERVAADLDHWAGRGVHISTVGARHDGAGVEVGTPDVARARVALLSAYGRKSPLIFVEEGPVRPLSSPTVPVAPQPGG